MVSSSAKSGKKNRTAGKNGPQYSSPILSLIHGDYESKTYIKLNTKIIDIFDKYDINFEIEDLDSIKIDKSLVNQIENVLENNKNSESVAKTTLSELIDKKVQLEEFDRNAKDILKNYTLFMGRDINITHSKNR